MKWISCTVRPAVRSSDKLLKSVADNSTHTCTGSLSPIITTMGQLNTSQLTSQYRLYITNYRGTVDNLCQVWHCADGCIQIHVRVSRHLVEVLSTSPVATQTRNLHVLNWKLIIISQLLATSYRSQSKDYNVLATVDKDDFGVAVRLTWVVDKPRGVTHHRRVDDVVGVLTEHVTADATRLVVAFSFVGQRRPDHFTRILNDHLSGGEVTATEQAAAVDRRRINSDRLTSKRPQVSETHRHRQIRQTRQPPGQYKRQPL